MTERQQQHLRDTFLGLDTETQYELLASLAVAADLNVNLVAERIQEEQERQAEGE